MLLIIIWYFFHNYFWPRSRPRSSGLGFEVLASFSITAKGTDTGRRGSWPTRQKMI